MIGMVKIMIDKPERPETLRSIRAAGYMLYKDGRRCQID